MSADGLRTAPDSIAAGLARQLENGTLDGAAFGHADHVRLGRWYVLQYGTAAALARFSNHLRRFAESHGSMKYHETITWAFLLVIADRLGDAPADQPWEAFAEANPDLLRFPGVIGDLYRPETLQTPRARARFRMPDREGIGD